MKSNILGTFDKVLSFHFREFSKLSPHDIKGNNRIVSFMMIYFILEDMRAILSYIYKTLFGIKHNTMFITT